jgi:hypothetical protein
VNEGIIPGTGPTVVGGGGLLYNVTVDITKLVRDIHASGPGNNYGLMLQMKIERRYRAMQFASFYHLDVAQHPQIIIKT